MFWSGYKSVIFDCDSTLSSIEGIDELADIAGKKSEVAKLTDQAMDGEIDLGDVYGKRLELLKPTKQEILELRQAYKKSTVPYAKEVISALRSVGVNVWIVSGGLKEAVTEYGIWLGVKEENIFAVNSVFDPLNGQWWDSSTKDNDSYMKHYESGLTRTVGKGEIIRRNINQKKLMIGDGTSDLAASDSVDLFVAYAGVIKREAVLKEAKVVVNSLSLAPVLTLALGVSKVSELLDSEFADLASLSLNSLQDGSVSFNDSKLKDRMLASIADVEEGRRYV